MKQVGNGPYWIYINKISSVQYSETNYKVQSKEKRTKEAICQSRREIN